MAPPGRDYAEAEAADAGTGPIAPTAPRPYAGNSQRKISVKPASAVP